jgi:threonine/homoserine/homoserine lactone efflux protein
MVPWPQLVAFFIASLVLIVMPGPSVLFIIGRSLALGRRGGVLSVVGTTLGMLVLVVLVALGLGVIVAQSIVLFTIVKFAGAAYLVYLGIQAIRHRKDAAAAVAQGAAASSTRRLVGEGFVVGVTNPKTIAFFVAVLPQFVDYGAGTIPLQMLELGIIFAFLAWASDSVWALAAGSARDWFAQSPRRVERLSAAGGAMMIGLGGVLALTGSKH